MQQKGPTFIQNIPSELFHLPADDQNCPNIMQETSSNVLTLPKDDFTYPAYDTPVQVTRSFGDCYMKLLEFNSAPLFPRFRCPEPYHPPYVIASPSITVRQLQPSDRFLILASDGLWNYLENQDAVDIVQKNVRGVS
jgi:serine/threonine protein phosphatase PrpC